MTREQAHAQKKQADEELKNFTENIANLDAIRYFLQHS